jgi:hypothetical protein
MRADGRDVQDQCGLLLGSRQLRERDLQDHPEVTSQSRDVSPSLILSVVPSTAR